MAEGREVDRMRVAVLGGAGFVGSHLCERLLDEGAQVVCVDDFSTGRRENVAHLVAHEGFVLVEQDVSRKLDLGERVDAVFHLASPASPRDYMARPIETLMVGADGTRNALDAAVRDGARLVFTSTSEVYGDPEVHPQREDYWGHVNPVGPRSCYDEAKRFAEALCAAYERTRGAEVRIARIFNTYGPRMSLDDGRVVPAFVSQALRGEDFTVFGDGSQTRSFCYVSDLVEGLLRLWRSDVRGPVNLGNPVEMTVLEFAEAVRKAAGGGGRIVFRPLPTDDPRRRRPDITRARELLGWEPRVSLEEGLRFTLEDFRRRTGRA